jgi:ubiquitin-conjugating enzyme E2 A
MANITVKRLNKELASLQSDKNKINGIIIENPTDIMTWNATITGPSDSPYENGVFKLLIRFNEEYPVKPPSVKYQTPMFHPNIYRDGKICVDILQAEWTPAQNVRTILLSVMSLLTDPNPSSPANRDAAILYSTNKKEYDIKVREFIEINKNNII